MRTSALAKRYAQALIESTSQATWESVAGGLDIIGAAWAEQADFRIPLADPGLADEAKVDFILALTPDAPDSLKRALELLVARDRLELLPDLALGFQELSAEAQQRQLALVTSAYGLSPGESERLQTALEAYLGKPVVLKTRVDATLIGGVQVTVGQQILDGSLRGALDRLAERLRQAPVEME